MTRTRSHAESSASRESGNDADEGFGAAKRPCVAAETWRVLTAGYVGGSLPVDYEYLDFQAHGLLIKADGVAGTSEEDFVINAKSIDAGNDESLSAEARRFYAGADLRIVLWTVRQGWGFFDEGAANGAAEGSNEGTAEGPDEGSDEGMDEGTDEGAPKAAEKGPGPDPGTKEWLCRRDFVQILGFGSAHFGNVQWIELSPPDNISDSQVREVAFAEAGEDILNGEGFRHYHNQLWTARVRTAAAASVRTLYVANRLASMGVSLSADGEVTFGPGVLGESFQLLASGRSVVAPAQVFAHFAKQSQFIYTACSKWKEIGLAAPIAPFPFGDDGPERRAFELPAPAWHVPVMAFIFQDQLERASRTTPRVHSLAPSMFSGA